MRDSLFPPPRIFGTSNGATRPEVARIHRICNRAVWQSLGILGKLQALAFIIAWPVTATVGAVKRLRRNAAQIRALTGKSVIVQYREIMRLALRHRISARYYYMFEFYLPERLAKAGDYVMRYEAKQIAFRMLKPQGSRTAAPIKNKIDFARYCQEQGLPYVPLLGAYRKGVRLPDVGVGILPEGDVFVKRVLGKGGAGAERWSWIGNGRYRSNKGRELDGATLLAHVAELSRVEPYLMQPALTNHAELRGLSAGALCTIRILTVRDERGGHEVTNASFRMSINPKAAVDNIHAGGLAAAVDLATGTLGPASDLGMGPKFAWHDVHPLTGAPITGRVLPFWKEALALAERTHGVFADWTVIGWDIAILDDGPRLIEGNQGPDMDLIQRPLRGPIGAGRFGALLAHNLERVAR